MPREDLVVKLILSNGHAIDVVTSVPKEDVLAELKKSVVESPRIELLGLDIHDNIVDVGVKRKDLTAYLILKRGAQQVIQQPRSPLLQ